MSSHPPSPAPPATTASLDQRVARVEGDVTLLSSRFDDFRVTVRDSLTRIEAAVSAPSAADAATTVMLADLSRRTAAIETDVASAKVTNATLSTAHESLKTQVATVGTIAKSVGISGFIALLGLVAYYVSNAGKLP